MGLGIGLGVGVGVRVSSPLGLVACEELRESDVEPHGAEEL